MKAAVVDASVAVKWMVRQPLTNRAYAAIERFKLTAPSLILPEIGNALWKYVRAGLMTREAVDAAFDGIESRYFRTEPIDESLSMSALALAIELDHPIYDCYYLALARRNGIALITDDRKLIKRATTAAFDTIDLAASPELDVDA